MRLLELFQNLFRIRPEEARRTLWAFLYLFFAIAAFIIGRISRSTLFLEIPGYREKLPLMYIAQAITVSLVMYIYARYERRLRRDQTNSITLVTIMAVTLGIRMLLAEPSEAVYGIYYIWVEVIGTFLIVQFWSFTNEIFHSRQAKRLFAFIGGGGVLSGVVVGFGIKGSVAAIGTENLLFAMVGCLGISLLMVGMLGRDARDDLEAARARSPSAKSVRGQSAPQPGKVFATRHVQLIAVMVVLTYLVSTLVDYQFQVIVGDEIAEKDARSAYFGVFFGFTGVLAGIIQFFLTSRILERFGVLFGLVALPTAMLVGSVGLLLVPLIAGLWAVAVTKGAENTLRYSVNDTALQLLYLPVPAQIRGRAKAFIDGILKPVSIGGAGVILAVLTGTFVELSGVELGVRLSVYQISWIVGAGLTGWLGCLLFLRKEYVRSLLQTLQRRRLNFADSHFQITDEATLKTLRDALGSGKIGEVLHALELLPFVAQKARGELNVVVAELFQHDNEEVRVAALRYLEASGTLSKPDRVASLLNDPSPAARAAATLALCAIEKGNALGQVHYLLSDDDLHVRAAAVAGLIQYGGLDGVLACADVLKGMLRSDDPAHRERAGWVLGKVGLQNFYQPLIPLLQDADERVRLSAIEAAGQLKSPELVDHLVDQLERPKLASSAAAALVAYGRDMIGICASVLADSERTTQVRAYACKILARLSDSQSIDILLDHLGDTDRTVRSTAILAVISACVQQPGVRIDSAKVQSALRQESNDFFGLLALQADLELDEKARLLEDALAHRAVQTRRRMFGLLSLLYPAATIDLVRRNLESSVPATRANALEVLDNLLHKEDKAYILPALEDAPLDRRLQAIAPLFSIKRATRTERLRELLDSGDPWLQAVAALAVANWRVNGLDPRVRTLLDSPDAICRETAIVVLRKIEKKQAFRKSVEPLRKDPVEAVSRYATHILATL